MWSDQRQAQVLVAKQLRGVAMDVVDEPQTLAHLHKEARAHATTQDGVQEIKRVAPRVMVREALRGEAQVALLRLTRRQAHARAIGSIRAGRMRRSFTALP